MTWAHTDLLWLLLALPLAIGLFVWSWISRNRATRRFGNSELMDTLTAGRSSAFRATRTVLVLLALTGALLALAGPQYGSREVTSHVRGVDVVVALDFSNSMLARDVRPSRLQRAKAELQTLFERSDRVGIVAFAGETIEFPMTTDVRALTLFYNDLTPDDMPVGGTALGRALVASKRLLERSDPRSRSEREASGQQRSQVVVLITDGEDHEGDVLEAAQELADAGIVVFTVGIGTRSGEPIPTYAPDGTWTGYLRDRDGERVLTSLTEEAEGQLQEIARRTGGQYFHAGRGQVGLDAVTAALAELHQGDLEVRRTTVHEPRYALILLPAFLFLVLEALLPDAWIGRRLQAALRRRRRRRKRSRVKKRKRQATKKEDVA